MTQWRLGQFITIWKLFPEKFDPILVNSFFLILEMHNVSLNKSTNYRIHTLGVIDADWLTMLSGEWAIAEYPVTRPDCTILVGKVVDQAALLGVLNYLYNLGLSLLLVECLENKEELSHVAKIY